MEFKEVKAILTGYAEYYYTILGSDIKLWYNKKYKQFEFKEYDLKNKIQKALIIFEVGDLKNEIIVYCYDFHKIENFYQYYDNYFKVERKFNLMKLYIKSIKEIHEFLKILEELNFFK